MASDPNEDMRSPCGLQSSKYKPGARKKVKKKKKKRDEGNCKACTYACVKVLHGFDALQAVLPTSMPSEAEMK